MVKSIMSHDKGGCRVGWHPKILAFFITAAFGLSIMSSLDCKFLAVNLGFIPQKYYSDQLGFGLWSYEAPDGQCLSYDESRRSGGFSDGDIIYSNLFINNDTNWTISRILALAGVLFGSLALISIWINVCKPEPHLVDILAYTTLTAFMSEFSKFGLFLGTDLCKSPDYWYSNESNEFSGSKDCEIDRGAFISISSIAAYFVSMIMAVGFAARPKMGDYSYDESSLPSFTASENGSTAKAHAPSRNDIDRNSSIIGDWSRVAPSTIASNGAPIEDYGMPIEDAHYRSSMASESLPREEEIMEPMQTYPPNNMQAYPPNNMQAYPPNNMQAYPPKNSDPRRYDDMSTLTWDPGY